MYFVHIAYYMEKVARVLRTTCGPARDVTENDCLTYGCCWDPTHDELVPEHCYTQGGKENLTNPQFNFILILFLEFSLVGI